jgi:hypothetical protein
VRRGRSPAQGDLRLNYGILIDPAGRVKDDTRHAGFTIGYHIARHFLKHPVHHTDVTTKLRRSQNVHARSDWSHNGVAVQTYLYSSYVGTKAVNEGHCADVQGRLVHTQSTRAVSLQAYGFCSCLR